MLDQGEGAADFGLEASLRDDRRRRNVLIELLSDKKRQAARETLKSVLEQQRFVADPATMRHLERVGLVLPLGTGYVVRAELKPVARWLVRPRDVKATKSDADLIRDALRTGLRSKALRTVYKEGGDVPLRALTVLRTSDEIVHRTTGGLINAGALVREDHRYRLTDFGEMLARWLVYRP